MSSACMQASATTILLASPTSVSPDTNIQIHQTKDMKKRKEKRFSQYTYRLDDLLFD